MARMLGKGGIIGPGDARVVDADTPDLDRLKRSPAYIHVSILKARGVETDEILEVLGNSEASVSEIKAILREFSSGHLFDDISKKCGYYKSSLGRELGIVEEHQKGKVPPEAHASRREAASSQIEQLLKAHLDATKAIAAELTPIVNKYIDLSDQTTVEGQRELCEYIRDICHSGNIRIKCPKTGTPVLVFGFPRPDRKNPLRVVFKGQSRQTHCDIRLGHVELVPAVTIVESHVHRITNPMCEGRETER